MADDFETTFAAEADELFRRSVATAIDFGPNRPPVGLAPAELQQHWQDLMIGLTAEQQHTEEERAKEKRAGVDVRPLRRLVFSFTVEERPGRGALGRR